VPGFDDLLTRELERAARPASPAGAFERVDRRRAHRARLRTVGSVALAVVVLAGTLGGVAILTRAFDGDPLPDAAAPDGSATVVGNGRIVVVRDAGQRRQLYAVGADGSGDRRVSSSATDDHSPSVSFDGSTVLFVHQLDGRPPVIATIPIEGGTVTWQTEPGWGAHDPAWSPDARGFAFVGDAGDGEGLYVMSVGLDGAAPHRIADRSLTAWGDPSWSPDGAWIVVSAAPSDDVEEPLNLDLYLVRADGSGDAVNLTDTPDASEAMPSWSPDGDAIAFVTGSNALDDTPTGGVATIRPDGSDRRVLTDDHAFEQHPTWAPDGTMIAFDRDDPAGTSVYTIRPDGSGLTRIALGADPAWQPVPAGGATAPPSPTPAPVPPEAVQDLGWAFPVCNAQSLDGDFDGNGVVDVAYVATKASDPGCPQAVQAMNVIGIDLDGDGEVDSEGGPISCELACLPFVAIDLNVDGDDELFVARLVSAVVGLTPYQLVDEGGPAIVPITFAPPGDPGNDLPAGEPPMLYVGGDEGFAARLECSPTEAGAVLNAVTGDLDSIEQPTAWTVRQTISRMDGARFVVLDSLRSEEPVGEEGPFGSEVVAELCGEPFAENGVFPPPRST
jgi:hypothetical protein